MTTQTEETPENGVTEKSPIWESNHVLIINAIDYLIRYNERWPNNTEIAAQSGLSRQTVTKHMAEIKKEDYFGMTAEGLEFMSSKLFAKVYERGMDGDFKCMKLAFEITAKLKKDKALVERKQDIGTK
jgi:hypothetical protein